MSSHHKRYKNTKNTKTAKSSSLIEVERQSHRGGPEVAIGKKFRFRTGVGIGKVGDVRSMHGPVRILMKDGVRVESAIRTTMAGLKECA